MSHTSSNYHEVAGVSVGAVQMSYATDEPIRYQHVVIHFTDGSTHNITAFFAPNATSFPLSLSRDTFNDEQAKRSL